jgi:D-arabinose 1-dehydrogenase-like Zn-dependent alcohol dehydrogenase
MLCETGKQKLQGFTADGFFAEYAVEAWQNLAKLPSTTDLSKAAPIFCAGITAFHAIDSCELSKGQWLAIVGCGGLGQLACQYAKAMGYQVIGIDINDETLKVFKSQGADAVFNSRSNKDYVEELKKLTNGGVHAAAVFSDADAAYTGAPSVLRLNGLIMCGECTPPFNPMIWLTFSSWTAQEHSILGICFRSLHWQVQNQG